MPRKNVMLALPDVHPALLVRHRVPANRLLVVKARMAPVAVVHLFQVLVVFVLVNKGISDVSRNYFRNIVRLYKS